MKRIVLTAAGLAMAAGLAACGRQEAAQPEPATPADTAMAPAAPAMGSNMAKMPMAEGAKMAKGTGTVTALDPAAGTITLDHGPIPEANWPAMTMSFKAAPEVAQSVKIGDKVAFDLRLEGGAGTVTAVRKQ